MKKISLQILQNEYISLQVNFSINKTLLIILENLDVETKPMDKFKQQKNGMIAKNQFQKINFSEICEIQKISSPDQIFIIRQK